MACVEKSETLRNGKNVEKDYYQTLGVEPGASADAIKLAYRRLARRFHPDISAEENATERFAEITEAYRMVVAQEILKANQHKVQNPSPSSAATEPEKPQDCHLTAKVSVEELYWGVDLAVNPSVACRGRINARIKSHTVKVKIPRGTQPGQQLRVRDTDDSAVVLTIALKPHERYDVSGGQLYVDMPISAWEAKNGAIVDVVTPGGRIEVDVPAGISSGQSIRLAGRGLPISDSAYGDLFVVVRLVTLNERTRHGHHWPHVPHQNTKRWGALSTNREHRIDTRV